MKLVDVWVVEIGLFLYAGRKSLVFSVSMQIDLNFVWVVEINLISVCGIELYLIPAKHEMDLVVEWMTSFQCSGSALIWFLCSGRK